jgi:hypothetical protein
VARSFVGSTLVVQMPVTVATTQIDVDVPFCVCTATYMVLREPWTHTEDSNLLLIVTALHDRLQIVVQQHFPF